MHSPSDSGLDLERRRDREWHHARVIRKVVHDAERPGMLYLVRSPRIAEVRSIAHIQLDFVRATLTSIDLGIDGRGRARRKRPRVQSVDDVPAKEQTRPGRKSRQGRLLKIGRHARGAAGHWRIYNRPVLLELQIVMAEVDVRS